MSISVSTWSDEELREQVARLDGYLDAAASISGSYFREYRADARLLSMPDEQTDLIELIKTQIQVWRYEDWQVNSAEFIDKWQHIDRNLFQKNLLIDPCGVSEAGQQNAIKARCYEIAWQATEMLDVIIDPRRGGNVRVPIARMELTNQESARAIFYAFGLGEFAILIQHCHIPKRTKWVSI